MLLKSRSFTSEFLSGQGNSREGGAKVALNWSKKPEDWRFYSIPCIKTGTYHTSELGFYRRISLTSTDAWLKYAKATSGLGWMDLKWRCLLEWHWPLFQKRCEMEVGGRLDCQIRNVSHSHCHSCPVQPYLCGCRIKVFLLKNAGLPNLEMSCSQRIVAHSHVWCKHVLAERKAHFFTH